MPSPCSASTSAITLRRRLLLTALLFVAGPALAQYQWRDEKGRMVFSDTPPPHQIDPSKVIRRDPGRLTASPPRPSSSGASVQSEGPQANGSAGAASADSRKPTAAEAGKPDAAKLSLADRELEARRKAQQQADAERKKKEKQDQEAKLARACDEMRSEVRTLESGIRITRVNPQGEREFMSDEDRSKRIQLMRQDMKESCSAG